MMNRQNRKDRCTGRDLHIQAGRILCQIPVGQHDAFTFSGRAGCKHDRAELVRFRFVRISSLLLFKELPERICLFILFRFLHGNQGFQLRTSIFYNCRHICADLIPPMEIPWSRISTSSPQISITFLIQPIASCRSRHPNPICSPSLIPCALSSTRSIAKPFLS